MEGPEIVNDLTFGITKAVKLPDGRIVTERLANKSRLDNLVLEKALESYRETLQELPTPPPGYYYATKIREIRHEGGRFYIDASLSLEPIIKGGNEMKKLLEISLREDGVALAGGDLETEKESKQLAAAFIVLANEDALFRASLLAAAGAIVGSPKEAKELSAISKLSAM